MGLTRKGMAPCGRLDLDTEGFLLVTDDGAMVHRLLSPAKHVDKCYEVTYEGTLPADAVRNAPVSLARDHDHHAFPYARCVFRCSGRPGSNLFQWNGASGRQAIT